MAPGGEEHVEHGGCERPVERRHQHLCGSNGWRWERQLDGADPDRRAAQPSGSAT
jgi:hypothetical protein